MTAGDMAVRERPILFSGSMIRAILDGRKSQTRRVVHRDIATAIPASEPERALYRCPYGLPGDRLWVRETWAAVSPDEFHRPYEECQFEYRADNPQAIRAGGWDNDPDDPSAIRWRPSIHMPRCASRITLELTEVRIERLQAISEADAWAEGCPEGRVPDGIPSPVVWFYETWEALNAKRGYGWDVNPWAWCLSFRRVTT